jgi:hypothetical protein
MRAYLQREIAGGFSGLCCYVYLEREGSKAFAVVEGFDTVNDLSMKLRMPVKVRLRGRPKPLGRGELVGDAEPLSETSRP